MPNRDTHIQLAMATETVAALFEYNDPKNSATFTLPEFIGKLLIRLPLAALGGALPDMIEPADNPHHRDFFHSAVFGTGVVVAMNKIEDPALSNIFKPIMRGYVSHVAADALTPMSIPLLTSAKAEESKPRRRIVARRKKG